MKNAQAKSILVGILILLLSILTIYAVGTTLVSPASNYVDTDGYLDLRASCTPTAWDGYTSYNISNATLYSNVDGTWKANITRHGGAISNGTFLFNFTNDINQSAEGTFQWNVQCEEYNVSNAEVIKKSFAGNNTIVVRYAEPTVVTTSPEDGTYDLDGHEIDVVCTASPSSGWNISAVSLMTNIDGTWLANDTFTPDQAVGVEIVANFTINKFGNESIADGTNLLYSCSATQTKAYTDATDESAITSEKSSANRTLNVEYPPITTLNGPTDDSWSSTKLVNLSWTTHTEFDAGTTILTRVWTNESGVWALKTGTIPVINNTQYDYNCNFDELTAISWTIEAIQITDGNIKNTSVNRSIKIDATDPVISVTTGDLTTKDTTPAIYATVTDANLAIVNVLANFSSDGSWIVNNTNSSPTSGVLANYFNNTTVADGVYKYGFNVSDSAGNAVESANYTLIIDTTMPTISAVTNVSVIGKCDQMNITFTVSESANYTLTYDTDTDVSDGTTISSSTKATSHGAVLDFDYNGEITYYFNISVTDTAGNNNNTNGQTTFHAPARVCQGWSQYAVYDALINLTEIQNQSGADLVYFWNATNQNWVYFTAGLTANEEVDIGWSTAYHVVHLYENTNSTWLRNTTNSGAYDYNVTSINNFVSVPTDYTFGNLTQSFMNASVLDGDYPFPSKFSVNSGGVFTFNITSFAGWNNSAQDYVSHIYNFTWSNSTLLEPCPDRTNTVTSMETFWVAGNFNVTWNSSSIEYNWTI